MLHFHSLITSLDDGGVAMYADNELHLLSLVRSSLNTISINSRYRKE